MTDDINHLKQRMDAIKLTDLADHPDAAAWYHLKKCLAEDISPAKLVHHPFFHSLRVRPDGFNVKGESVEEKESEGSRCEDCDIRWEDRLGEGALSRGGE